MIIRRANVNYVILPANLVFLRMNAYNVLMDICTIQKIHKDYVYQFVLQNNGGITKHNHASLAFQIVFNVKMVLIVLHAPQDLD